MKKMKNFLEMSGFLSRINFKHFIYSSAITGGLGNGIIERKNGKHLSNVTEGALFGGILATISPLLVLVSPFFTYDKVKHNY